MRERRLAAQAAGDVGENAVVQQRGVVGEKRPAVGQPEGGHSRRGGVAGADDAVLQMNVGIQLVGRLGIAGGQGVEERRAGRMARWKSVRAIRSASWAPEWGLLMVKRRAIRSRRGSNESDEGAAA